MFGIINPDIKIKTHRPFAIKSTTNRREVGDT